MKPWSAGVVFIEAFVTYFLVRIFSDNLSRFGFWSSLFGRDRFFAIVLVSVIVRLVFDSTLLPMAGAYLETAWQIHFDYRNNLYSFGLVIIALIANQMWKTGFLRGLPPLVVTVGVTYFIVRYILMEYTNFTLSNLGYTYEDLATSVLATPKAYIILLTAAFIASRMNLRYGWDFNGILIPSLLALQWYQPLKIFTSLFEALIILGIGALLMRTPPFNQFNIEGARKLLLFFNVGFVYKVITGYVFLWYFPEIKVTDTYAFGYLLSTLIAIKMHDKNIVSRLTRATLQTSLVAVVAASIIGFSLTLLPFMELGANADHNATYIQTVVVKDKSLIDMVREDKVTLYRPRGKAGVPTPLPSEVAAFRSGIELLMRYHPNGDITLLRQAESSLAQVNYQLYRVDDRYLYLREREPSRGWGVYVIDKQARDYFAIEVPAPLEERGTLEAGTVLFMRSEAKALAIAGARRNANPDGSADVLNSSTTLYDAFHRIATRRDLLQVRGYTGEHARVLAGLRREAAQIDVTELPSRMWVRATLPPSLDLPMIKELVGDFEINWENSPFVNRQRNQTRTGFAELMLNRSNMRQLLGRSILTEHALPLTISDLRIDGHLQEWLFESKERIAQRGTQAYIVPELEELLFLDDEVITPLWNVLRDEHTKTGWTAQGLAELQNITASAAIIDYELFQYRHSPSDKNYVILAERDQAKPRRFWGTYVFRLGSANNYVIQAPRPLFEANSFEYAVALFERLDARVLLIAGAHPRANLDGSSDVIRLSNVHSLFSMVSQALLRETHGNPLMVIQSRALGRRKDTSPVDNVLISHRNGVKRLAEMNALGKNLLSLLEQDNIGYRFVDGSPQTAGYEVWNEPQALYLNATTNKEFVILWVPPSTRSTYRQQDNNRQEAAKFRSLGIETIEVNLYQFLSRFSGRPSPYTTLDLQRTVERYLLTGDIVTLRRLQVDWPRHRYQRLIDRDTRQTFLLVLDNKKRLTLVANTTPRQTNDVIFAPQGVLNHTLIQRFIDRRAGFLVTRKTG